MEKSEAETQNLSGRTEGRTVFCSTYNFFEVNDLSKHCFTYFFVLNAQKFVFMFQNIVFTMIQVYG